MKPISPWETHFSDGSCSVVLLWSRATNRDNCLQSESAGNINIRNDTYRAIRHDQYEVCCRVEPVAPNALRPKQVACHRTGHAAKYGWHTRAILTRTDYADAQIDAMIT